MSIFFNFFLKIKFLFFSYAFLKSYFCQFKIIFIRLQTIYFSNFLNSLPLLRVAEIVSESIQRFEPGQSKSITSFSLRKKSRQASFRQVQVPQSGKSVFLSRSKIFSFVQFFIDLISLCLLSLNKDVFLIHYIRS